MNLNILRQKIFESHTDTQFDELVLKLFDYQYNNNKIYNRYVNLLGRDIKKIDCLKKIPFMPVEFFKEHRVVSGDEKNEKYDAIFTSSGTTGVGTSCHYVKDISLYYQSAVAGFEKFYGSLKNYHVLALLPAYLERQGSSLVAMAEKFMEVSGCGNNNFFLYDFDGLAKKIESIDNKKKILLLGVTFALMDFAETHPQNFGDRVVVMETGGMKGRKKELVRSEIHGLLKKNLGIKTVHSEYGMTELLSQAYSFGEGIYYPSNTLKILIRDASDPFRYVSQGVVGGINVVDLANIDSCSFIETKDLGLMHEDGGFEVLGRFDHSDTRGCNLLYTNA